MSHSTGFIEWFAPGDIKQVRCKITGEIIKSCVEVEMPSEIEAKNKTRIITKKVKCLPNANYCEVKIMMEEDLDEDNKRISYHVMCLSKNCLSRITRQDLQKAYREDLEVMAQLGGELHPSWINRRAVKIVATGPVVH